jgi:hypothetical protein
MKEHFLCCRLTSGSHFNTAPDSFQGFVFRADGDCVRIREVFWDGKNKKMMSSCQRVVFCPPKPKYTHDICENPVTDTADWYFTADGVMGYSLEYGRRIYRSLKNHYEYRPDDIQKVYDKEAILEYAL